MNCPNCKRKLKKVDVKVAGASGTAASWQCVGCDYFSFEKASSKKVLDELRTPLKIKQKIVKLSQDRLGIYLNAHVVRSLGLKKGGEIFVSVPDEKHIVLEVG